MPIDTSFVRRFVRETFKLQQPAARPEPKKEVEPALLDIARRIETVRKHFHGR